MVILPFMTFCWLSAAVAHINNVHKSIEWSVFIFGQLNTSDYLEKSSWFLKPLTTDQQSGMTFLSISSGKCILVLWFVGKLQIANQSKWLFYLSLHDDCGKVLSVASCHIRHINTNECHYYTFICAYKTTKQQNSKDWRQHMNRHTKPEQKK